MRADPQREKRGDSSPAVTERRGDGARRGPGSALAASAADPARATGSGERRPAAAPASPAQRQVTPTRTASPAGVPSVEDLVARLNAQLGEGWSFDVLRHHRNGGGIEVVAELGANGTRVQRTGASNGNGHLPLGAQLEMATDDAFPLLRGCGVRSVRRVSLEAGSAGRFFLHQALARGMSGLAGSTVSFLRLGSITRSMSSMGTAPSSTWSPNTSAPTKQKRFP